MSLIEFIQPDFAFHNAAGSLKQLVHDGWKQVKCHLICEELCTRRSLS